MDVHFAVALVSFSLSSCQRHRGRKTFCLLVRPKSGWFEHSCSFRSQSWVSMYCYSDTKFHSWAHSRGGRDTTTFFDDVLYAENLSQHEEIEVSSKWLFCVEVYMISLLSSKHYINRLLEKKELLHRCPKMNYKNHALVGPLSFQNQLSRGCIAPTLGAVNQIGLRLNCQRSKIDN